MAPNMKRDAPAKGKDAKSSNKAQSADRNKTAENPSATASKSGANVKPHPGNKPKSR